VKGKELKILVSDPLAPQGLELFQRAPGIEVDVRLGLKPAELIEIIGDYHGF